MELLTVSKAFKKLKTKLRSLKKSIDNAGLKMVSVGLKQRPVLKMGQKRLERLRTRASLESTQALPSIYCILQYRSCIFWKRFSELSLERSMAKLRKDLLTLVT